jgi:hypothetical protein
LNVKTGQMPHLLQNSVRIFEDEETT